MKAKEVLEFLAEAKKILDKSDDIETTEINNYSVSVKVNFSLKTEIRKRAMENGMTISAFIRHTLTELFIEEE